MNTVCSATQAVGRIPAGASIFVAGYAGHPHHLAAALTSDAARLRPRRLLTAIMLGDGSPLASWPGTDAGHIDLLHAGPSMRQGLAEGWARYLPLHLSEVSRCLRDGPLTTDVACVQVTPPDHDGRCHLGVSVDVVPDAVISAGTVLAEVNEHLPRAEGNCWIPVDRIDACVLASQPLLDHSPRPSRPADLAIAEHVADLVPDAATLQLGVGGVMEAVADALTGRRDLGIHSGLLTAGLVRLIECGAVTNARKGRDVGRSVATMAVGGPALHRFVDGNPLVVLEPVRYTHDPAVLGGLQRLTAVNSAFEVDLTGAVNAEAAGSRLAGGVGGQVDFARAAQRSPGGRFIIAMPSTGAGGTRSRIVAALQQGTPVTTARSDAGWVVTEYGAANLQALSLDERAEALLAIAHPDHRREIATHHPSTRM